MTHIFDRFYRVDSSRHAEGMHSGLGLSIVKGYVDLMGGSIKVDKRPGPGQHIPHRTCHVSRRPATLVP